MAKRGKAESLPPNLSVLDLYTMAFLYTPPPSPPTHTHTHSCSSATISVHLKALLNAIMIQNKNTFAALSSLLILAVVSSAKDVIVISL